MVVEQVLDDFGLGIGVDLPPIGEIFDVDVVECPTGGNVDSLMRDGLGGQTFTDAGQVQNIKGTLLKDAGALTLLAVFS